MLSHCRPKAGMFILSLPTALPRKRQGVVVMAMGISPEAWAACLIRVGVRPLVFPQEVVSLFHGELVLIC
jgi:hypothetical protein